MSFPDFSDPSNPVYECTLASEFNNAVLRDTVNADPIINVTHQCIGTVRSNNTFTFQFDGPLTIPTQTDVVTQIFDAYVYVPPISPPRNHVDVRNPDANDDISRGWEKGSTWLNKTLNVRFQCHTNDAGAAVWNIMNTVYESVVVSNNPDHRANYSSIAQAFADGHESVKVMSSSMPYFEPEINMNANIPAGKVPRLHGETLGGVIVVGGPIKVDGIKGAAVVDTGTVSIATGSNTVTGTGTDFQGDGMTAGYFIFLGGVSIVVSAVHPTLQELTLGDEYNGVALVDISYEAYPMIQGVQISNIIVVNNPAASSAGFHLRGCRNSIITNVSGKDNEPNFLLERCSVVDMSSGASEGTPAGAGVILDHCRGISVSKIGSRGAYTDGISIVNGCENLAFSQCYLAVNRDDAVHVDGTCSEIKFGYSFMLYNARDGFHGMTSSRRCQLDSCMVSHNGRHGIYMGGYDSTINGGSSDDNVLDGIHFPDGSEGNITSAVQCRNNGAWGVNISGSLSKEHSVQGNITCDNVSGSIQDMGTQNLVLNNISRTTSA